MTRLMRLVLVATLLVQPALLGPVAAHAEDDGVYDDGEYDEAPGPGDESPDPGALAPYGSWVDDGQYGRVWQPAVAVGWAPYVDGYWAWTPYGWTWVSYEPWAWTFHYGRWALLPGGWVWVPGSVWGPAWVDWYWGGGFVGWAPLSPFGTHVTVINQFVFVHERDFCSRNLRRTVVDHHLVPNHVIHGWQHHDATHERGPGLHHIERVSQRPVPRLDHKPPGTIAPGRLDRRPQLARPGAVPHLGAARQDVARLGNPWPPGRAPEVRRPTFEAGRPTSSMDARGQASRAPRLARPDVEPRLGAARRDAGALATTLGRRPPPWGGPRFGGVSRPPMRRADAAPAGGVRLAPPAVPGRSFGPPPGLLGARGTNPGRLGFAPGTGQGHQLHRGAGSGLGAQQFSPGSPMR